MARILIVDPDPDSARRLEAVLVHGGHEVRIHDGGEGIAEEAASWGADLVLMEVMLPRQDGYQVLAQLKAPPHTERPVIVITARGNARDITRGFEAGAADYLIKPVHLDVLMARVRTQLRLKEALDHLQAANADLQRLSELKGRVVSVVSHELRTPLTSIRGALDLVGRFEADLPSRTRRLVAICLRNTDRLIRLVNGVLTFARVEAGFVLRSDSLDMRVVIGRAREEIEVLSEDRGIPIQVEAPADLPALQGDADRLHQVLINLLSNAIRHSPPGEAVTVRAELRGDQLRVEVIDHGQGIAPGDHARLFQPFSQLDSPSPTAGGTGLGLAISREIVERHGGRIGVESELGAGSVFWFELPLDPAAG